MAKEILILGMHRSGTSILSKVLVNLGIDMGNIVAHFDATNVDGHNEDLDLVMLNDSFLEMLGSSWDEPPRIPFDSSVKMHIEQGYHEYCLKRGSQTWGVKDPRLVLFAEEFHVNLTSPIYIYMYREPYEISKSLNVRDDMEIDKALELTNVYQSKIEEFLRSKKHLRIDYRELIDSPELVLSKLCNFIDIQIDLNAISHISTPSELRDKKKNALKASLIHSFASVLKEPIKLFNSNSKEVFSSYLRRWIELYLKSK